MTKIEKNKNGLTWEDPEPYKLRELVRINLLLWWTNNKRYVKWKQDAKLNLVELAWWLYRGKN